MGGVAAMMLDVDASVPPEPEPASAPELEPDELDPELASSPASGAPLEDAPELDTDPELEELAVPPLDSEPASLRGSEPLELVEPVVVTGGGNPDEPPEPPGSEHAETAATAS